MSTQLVCDNCGKNNAEQKAVMTKGPLTLPFTNFKGEKYNLTLNVSIQSDEDKNTIDSARSASLITDVSQYSKLEEIIKSKPKVNNPNPHICVACIRELATKAMKDGFVNEKDVITNSQEIQFVRPKTNPFSSFSNNPEESTLIDSLPTMDSLPGTNPLANMDSLMNHNTLEEFNESMSEILNDPEKKAELIDDLTDMIMGDLFKSQDHFKPLRDRLDTEDPDNQTPDKDE